MCGWGRWFIVLSHNLYTSIRCRSSSIVTGKQIARRKKTLKKKEKELKQLEKQVAVEKKGGGVIEEYEYEDTTPPESLQELQDDQEVLFKPHPGVQTEFLSAPEDEVLFSGGRGSGKTLCMLMDFARYTDNSRSRGLIIRQSMPAFRDLIFKAQNLYLQGIPGTKWKEMEKIFVFPSGATLQFRYCENETDANQFIGQEYTWLGIDEITLYNGDWILELLKPSLRTGDPNLPIQIRATTNPKGPGVAWVKKRWNIEYDRLGGTSNSGARQSRKFTAPLAIVTGKRL